MTETPQPINKPPTVEQRLSEIATKSLITVRELKELVFQFQREENKSLKDVNDGFELMLKNQQFHINQKEIRNQEIKLELEYAEIKPMYDELQKKKSQPIDPPPEIMPEKKKKSLFF